MIGYYLLAFLIYILILLAFSWLVGRLLGVRQSWLQGLISSAVGMAVGGSFAVAVARQSGQSRPDPTVLYTVSLLVMMVVSVAFALLSREKAPPQIRLGGIPHPMRALRGKAARTRRYVQIIRILAKYGLSPYLHIRRNDPGNDQAPAISRNFGQRLRRALEDAGGVFVKLGQLLSTRPDLLPPDVIAELSQLQDAVTAGPYDKIAAMLAEELGAPPEEIFAAFDPMPLAAASIAQVYRARLLSGEEVVVKVQRPGIRPLVERDLDILLGLARMAETRTSWGSRFRIVEMAERFSEVMREELDFCVEAGNIQTVSTALEPGGLVCVPAVYPDFSTSRVLVIDWLDGVNVRDARPLLSQIDSDRDQLARDLFRCIARQIFMSGTFHADPHPGNVLILPGGQVALIDFGLVGRLNILQQAALRDMLVAVERRDPAALRDALLEIAEAREGSDLEQFERALSQLLARRLGQGMTTSTALFTDLFQVMLEFGLAFPGEVGGVFRALVTLEGTLKLLAPDFQILDETRRLASDWLQGTLTPASLSQALNEEVVNLAPVLRRLPRRLDRIANAIEHGELSLNVRLFADESDIRFVSRMVNQAVLAFLGASVGMLSVLLLGIPGGPALTNSLSVFQFFGYLGLVISAGLILRVLAGSVRP